MKNFLILGATSAIAGRVADIYAAQGNARFYLIGRQANAIEALSQRLGSCVVGTDCVDFVGLKTTQQCLRNAYQALGSFDIVLIAHGVIGNQLRSETQIDEAMHIISVNYTSVVAQLVEITQLMTSQSSGKIGVITSVAGDRGRPRNYTYGAAKGALNLYLQGLRSATWGSGLECYTFKLGPVDSPMTIDHDKNLSFSSVDSVAAKVVRAFAGRRYVTYIPGYWRWVMWVVRWLPEPLFQSLGFLSKR